MSTTKQGPPLRAVLEATPTHLECCRLAKMLVFLGPLIEWRVPKWVYACSQDEFGQPEVGTYFNGFPHTKQPEPTPSQVCNRLTGMLEEKCRKNEAVLYANKRMPGGRVLFNWWWQQGGMRP